MLNAAVVGSGPNGLVSAIILAKHNFSVTVYEQAPSLGGGVKNSLFQGTLIDEGAAFTPGASSSKAFKELKLENYGLEYINPPIDLAHPDLEDGTSYLLKDIKKTAEGLGIDDKKWLWLFSKISESYDRIQEDINKPLLHLPSNSKNLLTFGMKSSLPVTIFNKLFKTTKAKNLFTGISAHGNVDFNESFSSSVATTLIANCHNTGWPIVKNGSQKIIEVLSNILLELGGSIVLNKKIQSLDELKNNDIVMLDTTPRNAANILGKFISEKNYHSYMKYKIGAGIFKLDILIKGDIPWLDSKINSAGTVHLGGNYKNIISSEKMIQNGFLPKNRYAILGQQYLFDTSRSKNGINPIWVYAHVPTFSNQIIINEIINNVELYAPGFKNRIINLKYKNTLTLQRENPNFYGGDILNGANTAKNILFRPKFSHKPYYTGVSGVYICSAATPPGPGVHGMCGYNAAHSALIDFINR